PLVVRHVCVERVHQPRHPADAAFEEAELQRRKAIEHAAKDQAGGADHIRQWKAERRWKMLIALITLAADQPWMAMLQFEHPRGGMKQNRNIEVGDLLVEREQHFVVEIAVAPTAVELDRFEPEFFYGAA